LFLQLLQREGISPLSDHYKVCLFYRILAKMFFFDGMGSNQESGVIKKLYLIQKMGFKFSYLQMSRETLYPLLTQWR
jgi:hypothetical protein